MPQTYDFKTFVPAKITGGEMYDILQKYRITNCNDFYSLAELLAGDYNSKRINIIPLLKQNMDARVLIQLRLAFMIRLDDSSYYEGLRNLNTVEEISNYRKQYYAKLDRIFHDEDYENYWLLKFSLKPKQWDNLQFDFEYLYEDQDPNHRIKREVENRAGWIFLRNPKEAYTEKDFNRIVELIEEEDAAIEELLNAPPCLFEFPPVPPEILKDD